MAVRTGRGTPPKNLAVSEFVGLVQGDKVKEANITGTEVQGTLTDGSAFHTQIPPNYTDIWKMLQEKGVKYSWKESAGNGWIGISI